MSFATGSRSQRRAPTLSGERPAVARALAWLTAAAAVACGAWLWRCACIFPWAMFNEVRLEPSFLLVHGVPVYPLPDSGPVTTWIYGPLSILLFLPATLAPSAAAALVSAGTINVVFVMGAIALVCARWPADTGAVLTTRDRCLAALACIAAWPASSFQHIQADNAAVACGLLGNLVLIRSSPAQSGRRWLAAAFAMAALASKQTSFEAIADQLLWLAWTGRGRAALEHLLRAVACGGVLAMISLLAFGPAGLWYNLVELPAHLPWADDPWQRLREFALLLSLHVLAPALVLAWAAWRRRPAQSGLWLAGLTWAAAVPLGLAALFKTGGAVNSLHGLLLLLPVLVLTMLGSGARARRQWLAAAVGLAALAVAGLRLEHSIPAWHPLVGHLRQADAFIAPRPGEVWLPWNPLVTFYRERRFDHTEDGLYVRLAAGHPPGAALVHQHLPPKWSTVMLGPAGSYWGLALDLAPRNGRMETVGAWTIYSWKAP